VTNRLVVVAGAAALIGAAVLLVPLHRVGVDGGSPLSPTKQRVDYEYNTPHPCGSLGNRRLSGGFLVTVGTLTALAAAGRKPRAGTPGEGR
jgi:hypothetical protein